MPTSRNLALLVALAIADWWTPACAHGPVGAVADPPSAIAVEAASPPSADGVAELKFGEIFRMPVGPKGLQPSDKLLALAGKPVSLVGYMVAAERGRPGRLILSPLPASIGDDDEGLAEDLPPSAVFVHLGGAAARRTVPNYRGLIRLTGTLQVGAWDEGDGRVSSVRLLLDEEQSHRLLGPALPP